MLSEWKHDSEHLLHTCDWTAERNTNRNASAQAETNSNDNTEKSLTGPKISYRQVIGNYSFIVGKINECERSDTEKVCWNVAYRA